ncbi:hypothetical protein [Camelliibacillus cellulosilyticus]|uniref:hypothetical protein n=1 Tax=Camelliibacillus cellulosilyticus TaxID=2174486 RepID=UPI00366C4060
MDESGHPQLESQTTVLFDDHESMTKLTVHTFISELHRHFNGDAVHNMPRL